MSEIKFLTAGDVAKSLQVSRPRAYQLMAQGVIPTVRYQKIVRVPARLFAEWVELQERVALAGLQPPGASGGVATESEERHAG